jgi:hypothetical protein
LNALWTGVVKRTHKDRSEPIESAIGTTNLEHELIPIYRVDRLMTRACVVPLRLEEMMSLIA